MCIRDRSKVDVPKLLPAGHAVAADAVVRRSSCPMKKGDHGSFDPKIFATAVTPNGTRVYTLLVVSFMRGNSCILEAGRRVPDQLVVAIVQGRCLSQVVSLPQE